MDKTIYSKKIAESLSSGNHPKEFATLFVALLRQLAMGDLYHAKSSPAHSDGLERELQRYLSRHLVRNMTTRPISLDWG
uniref:Alkylmercury lyase n=1 Tax=Enterobacter hormaechei TaxID=158836 RepID=A0A286NZK5_9ENTR|nr:alkylmercury lyase [Enterobacter hormaechei]